MKKREQKKEPDEKLKEKQKRILLIGIFFMIAVVFAISGLSNVLDGNKAAGIDRILGAIALIALGIWYTIRDHRKK